MMGFLQQLHWREPMWLWLAVQPFLIWLILKLRQNRQLTAYADRALQPWVVFSDQSSWRSWLLSLNSAYILAWLLFAVAAAGPRLPLYTPQVNADKGMNIVVVLDTSRSMTVNDILPNRLRRAELELHEMLSRAQGQRVGVVVYAARPHVFVPLTWDFTALGYYLQSLDKLVLPTRGSQLADALVLAKDILVRAPQYTTIPSAIVLISDGDTGESDRITRQHLAPLLRELKQLDLPVYVLGVGSTEGGAIPLSDGSWLVYENKPVISRMDESILGYIGDSSGGRYSRATEDDSDWRRLYDQGMLAKLSEDDDNQRLWLELYPWVLFPAIVLFFAAAMPFKLRRPVLLRKRVMVSAISLLMVGMTTHDISQAAEQSLEQKAYQAYQQQQFNTAVENYSNVAGYAGRIGEGAAYYRLGEYPDASRQYSEAVLQADNDQQRAAALFNLGNSYFQQGDYKTAAQTFSDVLRYQDNHTAARHNLAISKTLHQQVTMVLMEQDNATMAGRGPRTARTVRELNVSENASLAIDESEESRPPVIPELPEAEQQEWQELIRKGLNFVQVAANGQSIEALHQRQQDLAQARLFMLQLQDHPAILWQRLFEREEGFTAPQSQPNEIPGMPPW